MSARTTKRSDSKCIESGFKFGIIECRYFPKPTRTIDTIEIVYINKGEGLCFAGDGITQFHTGDLFFFNSSTTHYLKSAPQFYEPNYPLRSGATYMRFTECVLPAEYHTLPDCRNISQLITHSEQGIKWNSRDLDHEIVEIIESMEQMPGLERYIRLLRVLNRLGLIVDRGETIAQERSEESLQSYDRAYKQVIEYLSHNFHRNITLDELAEQTGMNRTALCRHFRSHAGRSIFDYLLDFRINYTKQQLATTNLPISEIAQSAGFNNLPNFNVQFKRITNCTPGEYRLKKRIPEPAISL